MQTTQTSKTSVNTQTPPTTSTTSISHINTSQLPDRSRLYFDGSDEEELSDSYEEDEKDEDVYYDDSVILKVEFLILFILVGRRGL